MSTMAVRYLVTMDVGDSGHTGSGDTLGDAMANLMLEVEKNGGVEELLALHDSFEGWRMAVLLGAIEKGEVVRAG